MDELIYIGRPTDSSPTTYYLLPTDTATPNPISHPTHILILIPHMDVWERSVRKAEVAYSNAMLTSLNARWLHFPNARRDVMMAISCLALVKLLAKLNSRSYMATQRASALSGFTRGMP
jgi:hypothetical protein